MAFSAEPSTREISRTRLFGEMLVPIGREPTASETTALARILERFAAADTTPSRLDVLESYLAVSTESPWYASVAGQLGAVYEQSGYFSRAATTWAKAWEASRRGQDAPSKAVADYALGEWVEHAAMFGKVDVLGAWLDEVADRDVRGPAAAKVTAARTAHWGLTNHHQYATFSGPTALRNYLESAGPVRADVARTIQAYHPPASGTSLAALKELATSVHTDLEMRHSGALATLPVPAIVHFKSEHYSAVIKKDHRGFLVRDMILGGEFWMSGDALADEASGYVLVPRGTPVDTWRLVTTEESAAVFGHCAWGAPNLDEPCGCGPGPEGPGPDGPGPDGPGPEGPGPDGPGPDGPGPNGPGPNSPEPPTPCGVGMPVYRLHPMSAAVMIWDTPVGYQPPRGPAVNFQLTYNQRVDRGAQIPNYGHVGSQWTMDWTSWVWENGGGGAPAVVLRGQGTEWHVNPPYWRTRATLIKVSDDPVRYERRVPEGTVEVFEQPDRAAGLPGRRIFLTEIVDRTGQSLHFSYDQELRMVAVTDALGQVTTLEYTAPGNPMLVSRVTDPFGRSAVLTYDSSGRLETVTDTIGMSSRFVYGTGMFGSGNFITSMTTPYGTTSFRNKDPFGLSYPLAVEAINPEGGMERAEFHWSSSTLPATVPANEVPSGFELFNAGLNHSLSIHWDKRAMALYPGDVSKATITNWIIRADICCAGGYQVVRNVPHSVKRPLESRVWYDYPGRASGFLNAMVGTSPTAVARVLDDGTTQRWQASYNDQGMVTARIDPLGRQTTYTYAPNGIDLLEVRQVTPGGTDLLATYSNYTAHHQPGTITDAAGQTTTVTYNLAAQPLTIVNAKNETTTYGYDADGYLESVTQAVHGATTALTYDGFGRIATLTEVDGYTVTLTYDQLNRPTRVTYPDGTFDETVYDKLNVATRRDRAGRFTRYFYDAVGRPTAMRDPIGRIIRFEWCGCGSLQALIDGMGQRTSWARDAQGRVSSETRADGVTATTYTYDGIGRLKTATDPKGQVTTYTYALDNALLQMAFTNATEPTNPVAFAYDPTYRRTVSMTDGVGTTTYEYKGVGGLGALQLAGVDGPLTNDTIVYNHDELGRTTSRLLAGSGTTVAYDALSRVTSLAHPIGTFTYAYVGHTRRVQSVTYPNNQLTTYSYLPNAQDARLSMIHHTAPGAATLSRFDYTYDTVGNILAWRQERSGQPAFAYVFAYDNADQLVRAVKQSVDAVPVVQKRQAWAYDMGGNRTTDQADDAVFATSHDALNRLVTRQPGGTLAVTGTLDEAGTVIINGVPATGGGTSAFAGTVNATSGTTNLTIVARDPSGNQTTKHFEVDAVGASKTYIYDANGNLITDGVKTYTWNARQQLVRVSEGSIELASFVYDGLGRRIQKTAAAITRSYIYDDEDIVEERVSTGDVIRYVHGPGIDDVLARRTNGGATRTYLADHLGSIVQEVDELGQIALDREYDPWGFPSQGSSIGGYAFTGREWDPEVGLYHYRARQFDPSLGRFLTPDPLGFAFGWNQFEYVRNAPIALIDPWGENPAVGTLIGGLVGGPPGALAGGLIGAGIGCMIGPPIAEWLANKFADKGEKRNVRHSDLENLTDAEVQERYKNAKGPEKLKYQEELKGRRLRNQQKRQ